MSRPLVTVAIPLYNHEAYVAECLDSVLADGYPEVEVVIVDDGSKDRSREVAREWIQKNGGKVRRAVLLEQENRGICPTLNRLIREAQGDLVLAIASDDRLLPGSIAPRVALLEADPKALAVMSNVRIIDEAGNVLTDDGLFRYFRLSRRHLADARSRPAEILLNTMGGPLLLVRRSAYLGPDGIGLYDESLSFEDRDFFLRILARPGALLYHDAIAAEYRIHPGNHVGEHVTDKSKHMRIAPDYVRMAHKHAHLYAGALHRAILLDAWEARRYWMANRRGPVQRRLTTLVRRYKAAVLASQRRAVGGPVGP